MDNERRFRWHDNEIRIFQRSADFENEVDDHCFYLSYPDMPEISEVKISVEHDHVITRRWLPEEERYEYVRVKNHVRAVVEACDFLMLERSRHIAEQKAMEEAAECDRQRQQKVRDIHRDLFENFPGGWVSQI